MSPEGSVTHWLGQLKAGERAAAEQLWQRYFQRLVGLARKRLQGQPRRAADEEDVALSAFDSFCRQAEAGRFPQLHDRDNLWRLLVIVAARKAFDLVRDEHRVKRGGVLDKVASRGPVAVPVPDQLLPGSQSGCAAVSSWTPSQLTVFPPTLHFLTVDKSKGCAHLQKMRKLSCPNGLRSVLWAHVH